MIDFQGKGPALKWVCILLFILVTVFYFRGCGLRLNRDDLTSCSFLSKDRSISSIIYDMQSFSEGHHLQVVAVRPLMSMCHILAYETAGYQHCHKEICYSNRHNKNLY